MSLYRIALIGEAWNEVEAEWEKSFLGPSGDELNRMLNEAGISRNECFITTVFKLRAGPRNDLSHICGPKSDGDVAHWLPPLVPGKFLKTEYLPHLDRLHRELNEVKPNIAVLFGNTSVWAILRENSLAKIRGTCCVSPVVEGLKCLPTFAPGYVLANWNDRAVTVLDLIKARNQSGFPELRRPSRSIWIEPSLEDIRRFRDQYCRDAEEIAFDIETDRDVQITCIGFAPSINLAICIPFVDPRKPGNNYWSTPEEEREAWSLVAEILALPARKVAQNGMFDIQHLWQRFGIPVNNYTDDTMLLHHSLLPESPKGLAYLGSVYTDEAAWKNERPRGDKTIKRED